jgi:hypothetical protein
VGEIECKHINAEPYDEGGCFGQCLDCGAEDIPNDSPRHYPCTHPQPDIHVRLPYPACVEEGCLMHPWVL